MRDRWRIGRVVQLSSYRRAWRSWGRLQEQAALLRRPEVAAVDALRARYFPDPATIPNEAPWKYLDVRRSLRAALKRAQPVGLLRDCVPPGSRRVLDIGCGAGFFLFIAQLNGYDCLGLDVGDVPVYDETMAILGVRRIDARVEAFTPLPSFPDAFDLITAFGMVFNRTARGSWEAPEWEFFLDDVRRHLAPGGRLYLVPNPLGSGERGSRRSMILPSSARRLFLERGALIDRHTVLFPTLAPPPTMPALPAPAPFPAAARAPASVRAGSRRRTLARRALAVAAASLFFLAGAEIGVRALAPQEMRLRWYAREGVMVLVPGYRGSYARPEYASRVEINADGLRDREYSRAKAPDTFRILVLGDALTTGLQVPVEATYPKRLEVLLTSVHPRGRTEVVNAAIPGYGTADELRYLQTFGARWNPDLVVLAFRGGNDVANNLEEGGVRYVGEQVRVDRPPLNEWRYRVKAARSRLAAHSHLYHFLQGSPGAEPSSAQDADASAHGPDDRAGWRLTCDLVKRIDEISRGLGARLVLVTIPDPARAPSPASSGTPLLELASARGIPSLDLTLQLRAAAAGDSSPLWLGDRYFTRTGHERTAQALASYLQKERLIPS
jgi:SAM-dependent methyltransferase